MNSAGGRLQLPPCSAALKQLGDSWLRDHADANATANAATMAVARDIGGPTAFSCALVARGSIVALAA